MSRDGSGNYALPAGNPVVTGTTISSAWANATMPDIGTALTNSIAKDGQTTPTANLPMGGNRHTGVSDGVLGTQYSSINQAQNGSLIKVGSVANATDAYTGSITPAIAAYTDGLIVTMTPSATNTTTAPTLALNGLTVKPIQKEGGVACAIGDLVLNVPVHLQYTTQGGGYFMLLNPQKITGSRITAIADGQLSANVALLNAIETFTASVTFTGQITSTPGTGIPALIANGASGSDTVRINGSLSANNSFGLLLSAGTSATDTALNVRNAAGSRTLMLLTGTGGLTVGNTIDNAPFNFLGTGQFLLGAMTNPAGAGSFNFGGATPFMRIQDNSGAAKAILDIVALTNVVYLNANFGVSAVPLSLRVQSVEYLNISTTGQVTIKDESATLQDVGFRGLPQTVTSVNYTTVMADRGKHIYYSQAGAITMTIASNASVAYPVGTTLTFVNDASAAVSVPITINSDVMIFSSNNTSGSRTLAQGGMATALKVAATRWFISGPGLS